jgi:hypothetical protein
MIACKWSPATLHRRCQLRVDKCVYCSKLLHCLVTSVYCLVLPVPQVLDELSPACVTALPCHFCVMTLLVLLVLHCLYCTYCKVLVELGPAFVTVLPCHFCVYCLHCLYCLYYARCLLSWALPLSRSARRCRPGLMCCPRPTWQSWSCCRTGSRHSVTWKHCR